MAKKKAEKICEVKGCTKKATKVIDHFALTNEYSTHPPHHFCTEHFDGIQFNRAVRSQMREYASEDEQISGDYES